MRDFFSDYEKTKPKDEPKEESQKIDIGGIQKIVGIEVKKAMDSLLEKLETENKPQYELKEEPQD